MLDPRLAAWFQDYADGHRHPTNRLTHVVAIPLIVFHIFAMLDWVRIVTVAGVPVTAAHLAWAVATAWYVRLHLRLGLVMGVLYAACVPLGWLAPAWLVVAIAVGAWGIQLAGHALWEKNRPRFLQNLAHALIGPMFFVAVLTGDWPERRAASAAP